MKRGEIWLVDFGEIDKTSSVQLGERPAIIVSNDVANKYSPVITVIPLSTNMKKAKLPTHVIMTEKDKVDRPSFAMAEQVMAIDKTDMKSLKSKCTDETMNRVASALLIQLGMAELLLSSRVC